MSDKMIKRVARALCRQYELDDGFSPEQAERAANSEMYRNFRAAARAAIEAMRELPGEPGPRYTAGEYSRRTQEAMVDDALSLTKVLPEAQKTL